MSLDKGSLDNFGNLLRRDLLIEKSEWINGRHRGPGAKPMASGFDDIHLFFQTLLPDGLPEGIADFDCPEGPAAGHADADPAPLGIPFPDQLCMPLTKVLNRLQGFHSWTSSFGGFPLYFFKIASILLGVSLP